MRGAHSLDVAATSGAQVAVATEICAATVRSVSILTLDCSRQGSVLGGYSTSVATIAFAAGIRRGVATAEAVPGSLGLLLLLDASGAHVER